MLIYSCINSARAKRVCLARQPKNSFLDNLDIANYRKVMLSGIPF